MNQTDEVTTPNTVMPEKLALQLIKGVGDINDRSAEASDIINDYYSE